jgi:hypothetical protein
VWRAHEPERLVQVAHRAVKRAQELVAQEVSVTQVPAATALLEAATVTCYVT